MVRSVCGQNPLWVYYKVLSRDRFCLTYMNDLFLFLEETEVCNYADDTTSYRCGPNIKNAVAKLETDALAISEWFPNNRMKLNEEKCHLMIFGR